MKYNTRMLAIELQRVFHPIKAYKTYWEETMAIIECLNSYNKKMEDSIKEEKKRGKKYSRMNNLGLGRRD